MSISDHDFNEELDAVVETTIRLLRDHDQDEYSPVAFLATGEDVEIMSLDDEEEDPTQDELPRLAREFGEHLTQENHDLPECAFFAHVSTADDGAESLVIHGATPDGRCNVAYLNLQRAEPDGPLRATSSKAWHSPAPLAVTGNMALHLLNGMRGT
jgi:hypothetical protein